MSLYESLCERMSGRQYSTYFATYCVWDVHSTPALLVFEDGMCKCLSCNKIWNHKQLDKKLGAHFHPKQVDTVSRVFPSWRKWEREWGDLNGIVNAAHRQLIRNKNHQTYLRRRKIYEYAEEGTLGYLGGWITFPVYSCDHNVIDIVVRSISKESDIRYVVRPSDIHNIRPLYVPSWERVNNSREIYVVFGMIDAISLHLAGLPAVTGITGKSLQPELLRNLSKRFIIIPDKGEEREAHKLANSVGWKAKVKEIEYPKNTKDPDSIRKEFGNQYLLQTLGA